MCIRDRCKNINNFIRDNSILSKMLNRQEGDNDSIFKILSGKGIFPYEFIDSIEKLKYEEELKKDFYSSLNNENITEDDFKYYLKVWTMLKEKTIGNYSDINIIFKAYYY